MVGEGRKLNEADGLKRASKDNLAYRSLGDGDTSNPGQSLGADDYLIICVIFKYQAKAENYKSRCFRNCTVVLTDE